MRSIDWELLQHMRQGFLDAEGHLPDYWHDERWLAAYEMTLAQRIRWKWQAVLGVLAERLQGWQELPTIVDWGCGTGIASRSLLGVMPRAETLVQVYDRSPVAAQFAVQQIRQEFPTQKVEVLPTLRVPEGPFILLVSHVLSELDQQVSSQLLALAQSAAAVLWVEPGRRLESRHLSHIRNELLASHRVLGPCLHQKSCGALSPGHEQDWCHFFAPIPGEVHQSAFWREFSKRMKIDLRSLPVSWLAVERLVMNPQPNSAGDPLALILGRSRTFKGYCRWLACTMEGLRSGDFQKKNSKDIFRALSDPKFMTKIPEQQLIPQQEPQV